MKFRPPAVGAGYTLVELVVVITLVGVVAPVLALFMVEPVRAFVDLSRRAGLVDAAAQAQRRVARELRQALPNSVRASGVALELLLTADGDRYRSGPPGDDADALAFNVADDGFNTFARLGGGAVPPGARLAIYPLPQPGANPYVDPVLTPAATTVSVDPAPVTVAGVSEFRVRMDPPHRFAFDSPSQRVYLVTTPVSYLCDGGQLLRYDGYAVQAAQPATRAALDALAAPSVVAGSVEACSFAFDPGTAWRNAVVTVAITLATADERVRLVRQVHVENAP